MEQTPIDKILAEFAEGDHADEVKKARDQFFAQLKDLREDDSSYERLTSCFLNWYVFDRCMDDGRGTPLQVFAQDSARSKDQKTSCAAMAAGIHSLFEVVRLREGGLTLKDLFSLERLVVSERRQVAGLTHGDILEARLVPVAQRLVFAPAAFVLHPRPAHDLIRKAIRRSRLTGAPNPMDLIQRLQALNFRYLDRFRERVAAEKVYAEIDAFTGKEPMKPAS
jgi:hypothetical protein